MVALTPVEREQADRAGLIGRSLRQFALGRLAAHIAIRQVLGDEIASLPVDVLTGPGGEPQVHVGGVAGGASTSVSHSGCLAAACAYTPQMGPRQGGIAFGVDLERLRPTEVARSGYAFSRRERRLLRRAPEGPALAGLAGWTVKEAVWKALQPNKNTSPAELEIRAISMAAGRAAVHVGDRLRAGLGHPTLKVRIALVKGPDGWYVLSVAIVTPRSNSQSGRDAVVGL